MTAERQMRVLQNFRYPTQNSWIERGWLQYQSKFYLGKTIGKSWQTKSDTMSSGIIKHIENTQRPLIGLEYIAIHISDDKTDFKEFRCLACRVQVKTLLMRHILKHVESVEHQLTYLVSRIRFRFIHLTKSHVLCVFQFISNRFYIFRRFLEICIEPILPSNSGQCTCTLFVMPSNALMAA